MATKKVKKETRRQQDRRWARMEREADEAIARGEVSGPYKTAEETIAALHKGVGRGPTRKRRR